MIASGQTITSPDSGALGVILNVREIGQTADGRVLAEYEAIETQPRKAPADTAASISPYAIAGKDSNSASTRIVDARTLTEAQAVAGGVSRSEYREAAEAGNDNVQSGGISGPNDLDPAERAVVAKLQARDSAVKQEETAHAAAAGPYGSAPQYEYQIGPDGKAYAIGGHVDVSASISGSAEDRDRTLATLQNAALAANNPSGADMSAFRQASLLRTTNGMTENEKYLSVQSGFPNTRDASNRFSLNI